MLVCLGAGNLSLHPVLVHTGEGTLNLCPKPKHTGAGNLCLCPVLVRTGAGTRSHRLVPVCMGVGTQSLRSVSKRTVAGHLFPRPVLVCTDAGNPSLHPVLVCTGARSLSLRPRLVCTGTGTCVLAHGKRTLSLRLVVRPGAGHLSLCPMRFSTGVGNLPFRPPCACTHRGGGTVPPSCAEAMRYAGNSHPGGMFGQGAAWPWTRACRLREEGLGVPSPLRTVGTALVSFRDAPHDTQGVAPRRRGLVPSESKGGKDPSRTWECIIWHGQPICRVVGDAIVLHPRRPVSLKIGPQIQIQIQIQIPPPPSASATPCLSPFLLHAGCMVAPSKAAAELAHSPHTPAADPYTGVCALSVMPMLWLAQVNIGRLLWLGISTGSWQTF